MTAYPAWTPASRPGIIPLHPLSFGTILGRSFSALRQNPRVLLGFALVVQTLSYLVVVGAVVAIGVASFSRLDTVPEDSDAYAQIFAGSVAITVITGFVLGLAAGAIGVVVQGVVVAEVAHAAVAEQLPLRALWRRVRPVAWRLIGYALLLSAALLVLFAAVAGVVVALSFAAPIAGIVMGVLAFLGAIVLLLWLSPKLLLAPAAIILEGATIRGAVAPSWILTRGRFWSTFGVFVLIQMIFGALAQLIAIPFSIAGSLLGGILAPTGDTGVTGSIGLIVTSVLVQIISLLIQSVALVVQSTATTLIYIDCRMRHEGLDLDLLTYVERRDAGHAALPDPYLEGVGRRFARPLPQPPVGPPPGYPFPPSPAPTGAPPFGGYAAPQPTPGGYAPPAPSAVPPTSPPYPRAVPPVPPAPTDWTAPGDRPDPDAP